MDKQSETAKRLRLALAMFEAGVEMMRQNLIRRFPNDAPESIEKRLNAWLQTRDCAPYGDADGRIAPIPKVENLRL